MQARPAAPSFDDEIAPDIAHQVHEGECWKLLILTKEEMQTANEPRKKCSSLLAIREMPTSARMTHLHTCIRLGKIK